MLADDTVCVVGRDRSGFIHRDGADIVAQGVAKELRRDAMQWKLAGQWRAGASDWPVSLTLLMTQSTVLGRMQAGG